MRLSSREAAFLLIGITMAVLFFASGPIAHSFAGEPILLKREIQLGDLDVQLVTKNLGNLEIGVVKITDIFMHNATLKNNYDDPINFVYSYDMYLGMKKIHSLNKHEYRIEPQELRTITIHNDMNYTGSVTLSHSFQLYNLTDDTIIDWDETKRDTFIVFSQEVYATAFIQYLLMKHVWALAVPFVIISVRHIVEIWKS